LTNDVDRRLNGVPAPGFSEENFKLNEGRVGDLLRNFIRYDKAM